MQQLLTTAVPNQIDALPDDDGDPPQTGIFAIFIEPCHGREFFSHPKNYLTPLIETK